MQISLFGFVRRKFVNVLLPANDQNGMMSESRTVEAILQQSQNTIIPLNCYFQTEKKNMRRESQDQNLVKCFASTIVKVQIISSVVKG